MNNSYYETLDKNFNAALELVEKELSQQELMNMLKNGNIVEKQLAALRIDTVTSFEEADILVNNLTGCDGKIREAVSIKINEFMSKPDLLPFFEKTENYDVFIEAIADINANICRNVISAITNLKSNHVFCKYFTLKLAEKTLCLLDIIKDFDFQDGKYKVNKEVFKLYWCLETLYEFSDFTDFEKIKEIILIAKNINEYTIREKAAKILTKNFDDESMKKARIELKNDKNYYVRRF